MKKNRIEKVWIERQLDTDPDTSYLGEYTDKNEDWAICRHCGEFVVIAEKANERAEEIENELSDLQDDTNCEANSKETKNKIKELKEELDGLTLHDCPHLNREYNYFKPYAGDEDEGTENYQKYGKQDFDRMEGLHNGNWCFLGIIAKAQIVTSNDTIQIIRSGGLWGVESDSKDYLDEVGKDELQSLRFELEALGFGKRSIDYAFKNVETKE